MAEEGAQDGGFLGRWARRKTEVLHERVPEEPVVPTGPRPSPVMPLPEEGRAQGSCLVADTDTPDKSADILSLEDAQALTRDSDFKPFMAPGVGADVRNAAMKKLFADPHFNVMDGLDIYIDDYSKADPIPESMLRQMTSAKFLGLFADEEETEKSAMKASREDANDHKGETVAQSGEAGEVVSQSALPHESSSQPSPLPRAVCVQASQEDHANTDLRLQPDHTAAASGTGRST